MKKIVLVAILAIVLVGCSDIKEVQAHEGAAKGHTHYDDNNKEKWDYGLFADFIKKDVLEIAGTVTSVGVRTTYEVRRNEITALLGTITEF